MAQQLHVEMIRAGAPEWNAWRRAHTDERPDLTGAQLRARDLREANLRDGYLAGVELRGARLTGASLQDANLADADLRGARLKSADLTGANLSGATLRGADLSEATLRGAVLTGADARDADLRRADLTGANVNDAVFTDSKMRDVRGVNPFHIQPLYSRKIESGTQIAYKLVTPAGEGAFKGGVNYLEALETGELVEETDADTDEHVACAAGINVSTLTWALNERAEGDHILQVTYEADDIAAIPWTSDGKFRLHRCRVVRLVEPREVGLS